MKIICMLLGGTMLYFHLSGQESGNYSPVTTPVFQVNFVHPTADKPQSKIWYMDEYWWALLPDSTGPTLWQRTETGWKDYPEVAKNLAGLPGRVDVCAKENQVSAVGVGDSSLTVFQLMKKSIKPIKWQTKVLAKLFPPSPCSIETATIAEDGRGSWWVAATANSNVYVWFSNNGEVWAEPFLLSEGIDADDICVITRINGGVAVIWSDQIHDAISMRVHKNGNPPQTWEEKEIVDSGNKTADDHLNTSLSVDGTLWLATKNSLDQVGKPQFVLHKRSPDGNWENMRFGILGKHKKPSRPIVIATEGNSYIFTAYGDNDRSIPYPYNSKILVASAPVNSVTTHRLNKPQVAIAPDNSYKFVVHNVTGPKNPYSTNAPWIILAGDAKGRVYEADLKNLLINN